MKYVTNGAWGTGQGTALEPADVDDNFYELYEDVQELTNNPPLATNIASVTVNGSQMTFNMTDGSTIGPLQLPVLTWVWRGAWTAGTPFNALDVFMIANQGLYLVNTAYTSGETFGTTDTANTTQLFAFAPATNLAYDVGFYYPGVINQIPSGVAFLYQEVFVRPLTIPAAPSDGSAHQVFLATAPSTEAIVLNITQNASVVGTINVAIGSNRGTVNLSADLTVNVGDVIQVAVPVTEDGTAAGLSVSFSAYQQAASAG
jgi:hypothetical protein